MTEEAVVLDQVPGVEVEDNQHDLDDFVYTEYVQLFPAEIKDLLVEKFSGQKSGWKKCARLVKRLAIHTEFCTDICTELTETLTGKRTRKTSAQIKRETIAEFLNRLDASMLEQVSVKYNVSYNSFMNTGDKSGLIESIIDEMLAQEAV